MSTKTVSSMDRLAGALSTALRPRFSFSYDDGDDSSDGGDGGFSIQRNGPPGPSGPFISAGVIAGIVIGIVAFFSIIGLVAFLLNRRNQRLKSLYAYRVKDSLPTGASLEDGLAPQTRPRSPVSPRSPAGPPPPYQPPAYPPSTVSSSHPSPLPANQLHVYQFQSTQHAIDANREQTMDGSHRPSLEGQAQYSITKTPAWNTGTVRSELEGGPNPSAPRREAI